MTWMQTASGTAVDLLDPRPEQILLGDVAHHLARIARFCGATTGDWPWNVAQHSLLVESLMAAGATPSDRLVALLHDAHEAYVGDVISPLKMAMDAAWSGEPKGGSDWHRLPPSRYLNKLTDGLDRAIHAAFGLNPTESTLREVAKADLLALRIERDALMLPPPREWTMLPEPPDPLPQLRPAHPPTRAAEVFLDRFWILQRQRHGIT